MKQAWLDIWRIKVITLLSWWTALSRIFKGYLHPITMKWCIYGTAAGFINCSAMQNEEHRKQAAKMSWISCAGNSSSRHYRAFQQIHTKIWSPLLFSPRRKVSLPFCAAWHFQLYVYRLGATASFLLIYKYFWGYNCSSWITLAQLCLEESLSPFFPPWVLHFSSLDIWSPGNMATSTKAARGTCMIALASLSVEDNLTHFSLMGVV